MWRQLSRESDLVSIGSPWRVVRSGVHLVVAGTAATDIIKAGAVALTVLLAVLIVRGLPGAADPGAGVAVAVVLAWLFAWPYVLPWYDALAWALLALLAGPPAAAGLAGPPMSGRPGGSVAVAGAGWLLLARTTALGFGYLPARQADAALPRGLSWLQPVLRHGVTPAVLAAVTVWLAVLMVRSRSRERPDPSGTADPRPAATRAA
jgi:hypothetical protein